jgi:hypothetical protein
MYPVGYTLLKDNCEYMEREDEFDVIDEDGKPIAAIWKPRQSESPVDPLAAVDVGSVDDAAIEQTVLQDSLPIVFETKRQRKNRRRERS